MSDDLAISMKRSFLIFDAKQGNEITKTKGGVCVWKNKRNKNIVKSREQ